MRHVNPGKSHHQHLELCGGRVEGGEAPLENVRTPVGTPGAGRVSLIHASGRITFTFTPSAGQAKRSVQ